MDPTGAKKTKIACKRTLAIQNKCGQHGMSVSIDTGHVRPKFGADTIKRGVTWCGRVL